MISPFAVATLGIGAKPAISARLGLWHSAPSAQTIRVGGGGSSAQALPGKNKNDDGELTELIMIFLALRGMN